MRARGNSIFKPRLFRRLRWLWQALTISRAKLNFSTRLAKVCDMNERSFLDVQIDEFPIVLAADVVAISARRWFLRILVLDDIQIQWPS